MVSPYSIIKAVNTLASFKQMQKQYQAKYGGIPLDYKERLEWMYDTYKIDDELAKQILSEKARRLENLYYTQISFILYMVPEGAKRPRYRLINRSNITEFAKSSDFIHVYSPGAAQNNAYMRKVVDAGELDSLNQIICTPCDVVYRAYFPTPSYYNRIEKFMAEIGLDRPIAKPDFDNIAKLYADMYNANVWLDDMLTMKGVVEKYYSILPRVEIDLLYLNSVYNKHQYKNITSRKDFTEGMSLSYV